MVSQKNVLIIIRYNQWIKIANFAKFLLNKMMKLLRNKKIKKINHLNIVINLSKSENKCFKKWIIILFMGRYSCFFIEKIKNK